MMLTSNRFSRFALLLSMALSTDTLLGPGARAGTYKVLHSFAGGSDGGGPLASLAVGSKGNLYGTTWGSGPNGSGTVFELTRSPNGGWIKSTIYSFCSQPGCTDGGLPTAGVIVDAAGNVYGSSNTTAFELTPGPSGWSYSAICDCGTIGGFVLDGLGNLYGTWGPGDHKAGNIFELSPTPSGWMQSELYSFCPDIPCRSGWGPQSAMTFDAKGNLYGTTEYGGNTQPYCFGSAGCGVVFKLKNLGGGQWEYYVLHRFAAFAEDGQTPIGGVVVGKDGNVYGTTTQAGKGGGTIFQLSRQPDGHWKETILYDFPNPVQNGGYPASTLVFDQAGNLYGTATAGGDPDCDCGVIFKMTHQPTGQWTYSVLYEFTWSAGAGPNGLTIDSKGHLYGTTAAGGRYNYGVAFKFVP